MASGSSGACEDPLTRRRRRGFGMERKEKFGEKFKFGRVEKKEKFVPPPPQEVTLHTPRT